MTMDSIQSEEKRPSPTQYEAMNWERIEAIRQLPIPEKTKRAFAGADFALCQKKLILAKEHPGWTSDEVTKVARRLVYGVIDSMLPMD